MATPKFFFLAAGSYTNKSNDFVYLIPFSFTAANRVLVSPGKTITVPTGGAQALQGDLETLRGFIG